MQCLWNYIPWYSCVFLHPKNFFQLHPAGWPGWNPRICSCHCLYTRHSSSSTIIMFTIRWVSLPSRSWLPQRPGRPAAAATATAAVALRASGAFPLRPWQLAAPASGSVIWTTTLSGRTQNLKVDACVDRLRLPSWGCPRSRREQGWCCLGRGGALMMLTSRISHRKTLHCVLWIDWFNSIVLNWNTLITFS